MEGGDIEMAEEASGLVLPVDDGTEAAWNNKRLTKAVIELMNSSNQPAGNMPTEEQWKRAFGVIGQCAQQITLLENHIVGLVNRVLELESNLSVLEEFLLKGAEHDPEARPNG